MIFVDETTFKLVSSTLVEETKIKIQNKIRGDANVTLLSKPHDKITDTWGS